MGEGCRRSKNIVEAYDLRPIRIFGARRLTMQGRNRRLHRERTGPAAKSLLDQRQRLGDLSLVPASAILLFENHQIAHLIQTGIAPCVLQQHERDQSGSFCRSLGPHQHPDQTPQPYRLGAEVGPHQRPASCGRIAFVEHQIDYGQHGVQPLRQVVRLGHDIRNAGGANFALGAYQPLRHGGRRHQKRPRNLLRLQAAQRAEGQRYLRLRSQRRVATGEDQPKAIVGNFAGIVIRLFDGADQAVGGIRFKFFLKPRPAPDVVDGLVPGCLNDPCARELRDAGAAPLVHGRRKRFLRSLFGQIIRGQKSGLI